MASGLSDPTDSGPNWLQPILPRGAVKADRVNMSENDNKNEKVQRACRCRIDKMFLFMK